MAASSVLETFFILFKTDASDAEKGSKKAKESVDDLEGAISGADKGTLQLGKKFNKLATTAVAAFASIFAVTSLVSGARGIAEQSAALGVLSDTIGASEVDITNLGRAVENMGGSSDALKGSLRGLQGTLDQVLTGGPNAATLALKKLGVATLDEGEKIRSVLDVLPEVAAGFEGLPRALQNALGQDLGLDEGLMLLLRAGPRVFQLMVERQASLNTVTEDQIEDLRLLNLKWTEFKNTMSDLSTQVLLGKLLPAFQAVEDEIRIFAQVLDESNQSVLGFFSAEALAALEDAEERWLSIADAVKLANAASGFIGPSLEVIATQFDPADSLEAAQGLLLQGADLVDIGLQGIKEDFANIRDTINEMSRTRLIALGAGNLAEQMINSGNRSTSVNIDEINIETQATDAAGIAAGLSSALETELSNATEQFDDGVAG